MTFITTPERVVATDSKLVQVRNIDLDVERQNMRELHVHPDIESLFLNNALLDQHPHPKIASIVSRYVSGSYLTVSLFGDPKGLLPVMERMSGDDEVWAICFREPKGAQWRLFGRFIRKDVFYGLALYQRSVLGTKKTYGTFIADFVALWEQLFPSTDYIIGTTVDEYLSEPYQNVDQAVF